MAEERAADEIVTKFFLDTCQLCPQSSKYAVQAAISEAWVAAHKFINDRDAEFIPLTTGSIAEFYVEPMLSCVGDIDVMFYTSTTLAIPAGQKPPAILPDEFHSCVTVVEIIDSHLPGYVYLKSGYFLIKCSDDGKYRTVKNDRQQHLSNRIYAGDNCEIHGPALLYRSTPGGIKLTLPIDAVRCVRCLSWPPQAADWPTRPRNNGWPDAATVDCVLNNGSDVVGVAHRQCRQDEWMGVRQWRLSFSRAEIVLINSWMPVQQIVYHMLRVFAKTEHVTGSTDKSGPERLSNYHIKTLMLWACELKPIYWWTDDLGLVRICVELLHILAAGWLTYKLHIILSRTAV